MAVYSGLRCGERILGATSGSGVCVWRGVRDIINSVCVCVHCQGLWWSQVWGVLGPTSSSCVTGQCMGPLKRQLSMLCCRFWGSPDRVCVSCGTSQQEEAPGTQKEQL